MGLGRLDRARVREEAWEEAVVAVWEGWAELAQGRGQLANASVQPVEQEPLIRQGSLAIL